MNIRKTATLVLGTALILGGVSACGVNPQTQICTVTGKDRSSDKDGSSIFRVYTEQCGTLGLADNLFAGRFNSADDYGRIKEGKTYRFETVGIRNGLFSMFPEINKMYEVNPTQAVIK